MIFFCSMSMFLVDGPDFVVPIGWPYNSVGPLTGLTIFTVFIACTFSLWMECTGRNIRESQDAQLQRKMEELTRRRKALLGDAETSEGMRRAEHERRRAWRAENNVPV